jgi:hypothetical protein
MILTSECRALGEGAITTYLKRLRFDVAGMSGARTHDLPGAKEVLYHCIRSDSLLFALKKEFFFG